MSVFTGFDSAWGGRQKGALCDLRLHETDGGPQLEIVAMPTAVSWPEAMARFSQQYVDVRHHIVAIDQGLVVPNTTGQRAVEKNLARALMADFSCGAHSSNRSNTACYGPNAGIWNFVEQLEQLGYQQWPSAIPGSREGKFYFECFPHSAIIALFNLPCLLAYKVSKKNQGEWARLIHLLRSLARISHNPNRKRLPLLA